jgi:hypothetical protein
MVELCIYLICIGGSFVNFHELFVDPIKVKFRECYSHGSKNPKKYEICCLILFQSGFLFMPKSAFLSVIFGIGKYTCSITIKILWSPPGCMW